jgi:hypothetical protein
MPAADGWGVSYRTGSKFIFEGRAGAASPITLQLNVPTHCMVGVYEKETLPVP